MEVRVQMDQFAGLILDLCRFCTFLASVPSITSAHLKVGA